MSNKEDDNMQNNEEYENVEEIENMEEMNQNEEEYEEENMNENGEEEEGQDVYAFDIQINEDSYLLVIGKTDENKLLLRLIDKEDETKPFFQNEFNLEDLRNLNEFFNRIDDENIAYQYIISNLNDADKEIKILDEEKIKLSISINEEGEKIDISFILFKIMNDMEGEGEGEEENQEEVLIGNNNEQHENEGDFEEGLEIMENLIEGREGDEQIEQVEEAEIDIKNIGGKEESNINEKNENIINKSRKSGKSNVVSSSNIPEQVDDLKENIASQSIEKKEISKKNVNGVETIIERKEIKKISSNQNQGLPEEKKEITIITETKSDPNKNKEIRSSNQRANMIETQKIISNNEDISLVKEELLKIIAFIKLFSLYFLMVEWDLWLSSFLLFSNNRFSLSSSSANLLDLVGGFILFLEPDLAFVFFLFLLLFINLLEIVFNLNNKG